MLVEAYSAQGEKDAVSSAMTERDKQNYKLGYFLSLYPQSCNENSRLQLLP